MSKLKFALSDTHWCVCKKTHSITWCVMGSSSVLRFSIQNVVRLFISLFILWQFEYYITSLFNMKDNSDTYKNIENMSGIIKYKYNFWDRVWISYVFLRFSFLLYSIYIFYVSYYFDNNIRYDNHKDKENLQLYRENGLYFTSFITCQFHYTHIYGKVTVFGWPLTLTGHVTL